jgi:hypothetical protein
LVTPRKDDEPREKPWLWRRTAMTSSSRLMLSMHAVSAAYLATGAGRLHPARLIRAPLRQTGVIASAPPHCMHRRCWQIRARTVGDDIDQAMRTRELAVLLTALLRDRVNNHMCTAAHMSRYL